MNEESRRGLLENLDVFIGNERLIFLLDDMEIAGTVGRNRTTVQRLFPPSLRFFGPDALIRRLKNPKALGQSLKIEGLLYTGSRIFFVMEVGENEEAGAQGSLSSRTPGFRFVPVFIS